MHMAYRTEGIVQRERSGCWSGEQAGSVDLFSRYLFRQMAGSFLLILVTLTAIIWIASALGRLELMTTEGQSFLLLLKMTTLALPELLFIIAPIALLLAFLYTLDRLNGDSELIVMSAAGARVWRFAMPACALAGVVAFFMLLLSVYLSPVSMQALRAHINQVRTDLIAQVLQPGRFTSPERGLTFHIRDRTANGELLGVIVHDTREENTHLTYLAQAGQIVKGREGSYLVMRDGHIQRRETADKDKDVQIVAFEQYIFDITQYQPRSEVSRDRPKEMYAWELMAKLNDPSADRPAGEYRSELHERFASALYPFAYMMIAVNFLGHARTNRQSRWMSVFAAFALAVLIRAAGVAAIHQLSMQASAVVFVYGIPLVAILVAALFAHVRMAPHARFTLSLRLPAKLQAYNDKFWAARGVKTEYNGGSVG